MLRCTSCALHNPRGTICMDCDVHGNLWSCMTWRPCVGADLESRGAGPFSPSIRFKVMPFSPALLCVSAPFFSFICLLFTPLACGPT